MTAVGWGTTAYYSLPYSDIDVNLIQRADLCVDKFMEVVWARAAKFNMCYGCVWTCRLRLLRANVETSWYWICVP